MMTGKIDCPSAFRDLAERNVKPHYAEMQEIEVDFFTEGNLIQDYAEVEFKAIKFEASKFNWEVPFTQKEFIQYCKAIVVSRIAWVLGDSEQLKFRPTDNVMTPSLIDAICKQIGLCTNTRLGVILKPKMPSFTSTKEWKVDMNKMNEISFFLHSMDNYVGARGYLRDKQGVWDFMTMQLIDNQIKNPTMDPHPVYSVFAAVIGPKMISSVLSPMVKYGDLDVYRGLLWELTSV